MKKQQQHQAKYTQKCEETHSKRYIDDNTQLQKTANSENIKNQKQRKKGEREGGKEQRDISYIYVYTNAAIKFGVVCEFVSNTLESKKHQ